MKTLVTILFSLALLGTQSVFIVGAPLAPPVSQCACDKCATSCCKKKASSDSQPLPSAPVRSSAQSEWQFLAAVIASSFLSAKDHALRFNMVSRPLGVDFFNVGIFRNVI